MIQKPLTKATQMTTILGKLDDFTMIGQPFCYFSSRKSNTEAPDIEGISDNQLP
jgi:hypothetical protein